jgi:hypothetical protein
MPSGPVITTCQPSSARVRPLATAAATLNRTVVVASSPLDACTMKVTALPFCTLHPSAPHFGAFFSGSRALAISVPAISIPAGSAMPALIGGQEKDLEAASRDSPFRKSSSACFPARCAAR